MRLFNLGIGLDMHLGKDYRYYNTLEPPLPNYLRIQMEKENVVIDAMKGWALSDYQIDEAGKSDRYDDQRRTDCYVFRICTPDVDNWRRLGFTQSQFEWCEK